MPSILSANEIKATGYDVANSLRFNDGSSDCLTDTMGTATNRKIFTHSFWIKRGILSSGSHHILESHADANNRFVIFIHPGDDIRFLDIDGGSVVLDIRTNAKLRDPSAWYHIVCAVDTTQSTASNRTKIYINGVLQDSFSTNTVYSEDDTPDQGTSSHVHNIGRYGGDSGYFDGYMSEVVFIDGLQLAADQFGEFDSDSGIWKPIDVSGLTFGTNGFYLDFEDSGALGDDVSGNGNDFTVNNLTAIDQTTDTPTNNFATWNPLAIQNPSYVNTLSNGNLTASNTVTDWYTTFANFSPSKGKWYWEVKPTTLNTTCALGIYFGQNTFTTIYPNTTTSFYCHQNGNIYMNSTTYTYMASYSVNDIIIFALDMDNGKFYMGKNGSWADGSGNSNQTFANAVSLTTTSSTSFPTDKDVFPITSLRNANANINFGSPPYTISSGNTDGNGYGNFEYAVPSGYYSLNTKNLAEYG